MLDKLFIEEYVKRNNIPNNPRRILTEYLQSEILSMLYTSKFGKHLSFLGGTCLRFVYNLDRFSEDLDFNLIEKDLEYEVLAKHTKNKLEELGFKVDTRVKEIENIFIIFFKFSEVMLQMGLSAFLDQKILIKFEIDPNPQKNINYESRQIFSYGKNFNVIANTLQTLFAQKTLALFLRPYQKGRDFYDMIWFLAQKNLEPEYKILQEKGYKISNKQELIAEMKKVVSKLNLKQAARDVEPFLFYPEKAKWIERFGDYLDGAETG